MVVFFGKNVYCFVIFFVQPYMKVLLFRHSGFMLSQVRHLVNNYFKIFSEAGFSVFLLFRKAFPRRQARIPAIAAKPESAGLNFSLAAVRAVNAVRSAFLLAGLTVIMLEEAFVAGNYLRH